MAHNTTYAYTAGIIDGEGCVRIAKIKKKNPLHSTQYLLRVSVKMTDLPLLEWLKLQWGGNIYKKKLVPGRKQQWDWVIQAKAARDVLSLIRPYTMVKSQQIDVAMSLILSPTGRKILPDELAQRETLFMSIKELNTRGTS